MSSINLSGFLKKQLSLVKRIEGAATPFSNLVDGGMLDSPVFSFYLTDDDSGVLTLGGTDPAHHSGALQWLPLAA